MDSKQKKKVKRKENSAKARASLKGKSATGIAVAGLKAKNKATEKAVGKNRRKNIRKAAGSAAKDAWKGGKGKSGQIGSRWSREGMVKADFSGTPVAKGLNKAGSSYRSGKYKLTSARKAALKKAQKLSARVRKKLGK